MSDAEVLHITRDNWQSEVLNSPIPVLVDFWAEWCGPCRAIAPILAELSNEYAGRLKVAKVNVDEYPDLANQFGIRSIPTLILLKNGERVEQVVGAMPKAALADKIDPHLG